MSNFSYPTKALPWGNLLSQRAPKALREGTIVSARRVFTKNVLNQKLSNFKFGRAFNVI